MEYRRLLIRAWSLYWTHFYLIAAISIVVWMPGDLLAWYFDSFVSPDQRRAFDYLFASLYSTCVGVIATGAIYSLFEEYPLRRGTSLVQALKEGCLNWSNLCFTTLVLTVLSVVGFLLLIVPCLILVVRCSIISALVVREQSSGFKAIRRSFELTKGRFWRLLGWGLCVTVYLVPLSFLISGLTSLPILDWWFPTGVAQGLFNVVEAYVTVFMWVVYDELLKQETVSSSAAAEPPSPF